MDRQTAALVALLAALAGLLTWAVVPAVKPNCRVVTLRRPTTSGKQTIGIGGITSGEDTTFQWRGNTLLVCTQGG